MGLMSETTLQDLLRYVREDDRVCPCPQRWDALWNLLPDRRQKPNGSWEPSVPLILGGWFYSSRAAKAHRLVEHIQYAHAHGALTAVDGFLRSLSADEWCY